MFGCVDSPASRLSPLFRSPLSAVWRHHPTLNEECTEALAPLRMLGTPLKSIVSSVLLPEAAKEDTFHRDEKGLYGYHTFGLVPDALMSVWSTMKKMKLKTVSTWMVKTLVSVVDMVIKLREESHAQS